jgi:2-dehydro-3-deoxy-D-arabinonate dehydratase
MQLIRYRLSPTQTVVGITEDGKLVGYIPASLDTLLGLRADELRVRLEQVTQAQEAALSFSDVLAPIDGETEVWAAGVTYKRSMDARREESETPDIYSKVYSAARPELFFKAVARRVSGQDQPIAVRADSTWDVPEPELALVINAYGEIVGYTVGNDVSSRSIEGENPLYLPQAKVYAGSCALGPAITPAWEIADPYSLTMYMTIERNGETYWTGQTNVGNLHRRLEELVEYLYREDDFPGGAILCTGTALVPDHPFTLQAGDTVKITIDQIGTLRNPVVRGKAAYKTDRSNDAVKNG